MRRRPGRDTLTAALLAGQQLCLLTQHTYSASGMAAWRLQRSVLVLFLAAAPLGAALYGPPPCSGNERPFSGVGLNASACGFYPCSSVSDCPAPPSGVTARPTCTSSYCVLACGELVGGDCASAATCFDLGGIGVGVCLYPDRAGAETGPSPAASASATAETTASAGAEELV